MASIEDRLLALEAMLPINDNIERQKECAYYGAKVMIGFVVDGPDKAQEMIRLGVPEDEARRFSAMGFKAAQRELMAKLHTIIEEGGTHEASELASLDR